MDPYFSQSGVVIYHGDCADVLDGLRDAWGTRPFDLLLTDPPYGIGFAARPTKWQRRQGHVAEVWDDAPASAILLADARALARWQIVWGGNYFDLPTSRCWLSWHKPDAPPSMGNVEYAWTNLDQNSRQISYAISASNAERVGHPTQKPEAVMLWAIGQVAADVGRVLDPFMGSGTTLVAAKRLGKQAVGVEQHERYCEIAARRLAQEVLPDLSDDPPLDTQLFAQGALPF